MSVPAFRLRSTTSGIRARAATVGVASARASMPTLPGNTIGTWSSPPALVEHSPTPITRSPNSSGCCSARAMIVMPPIECPIRITGPVGANRSTIPYRSAPSWSMLMFSFGDRPERPCERWS